MRTGASSAALAHFGHYLAASRIRRFLPEPVRQWVRVQLAEKAGLDGAPSPLLCHGSRGTLSCRLAPLPQPHEWLLVLSEQPTAAWDTSLAPLGLSRRESEVMRWVTEGKTNAEIGTILGISPRTVQKHLEHIFTHLGVETRTAAVARATERLRTASGADGIL